MILGHNPFIGVDHLSQERGRERATRFADPRAIESLVDDALELGVDAMMVSTHRRVRDLLEVLAVNERARRTLRFYPMIPYAQGYVRRANEIGLVRLVQEALLEAAASAHPSRLLKTALDLARGRPWAALGPLIDAELRPFRPFRVEAICLHNVLTDLLLGYGSRQIFAFFDRYTRARFGVRPAYVTLNYPMLAQRLASWGLSRPLIVTSFNKLGFQMNPSRQACEQELPADRNDVVAMSIFAAGLIPPAEAADYLRSLPRIESVVFGASSREHLEETRELLRFVEA